MIMWEKFKRFFETKYRVVPVYTDNKKCGFAVQVKSFLSQWVNARVQTLEKVKSENDLLIDKDAFFNTEDEAREFIASKKTIL